MESLVRFGRQQNQPGRGYSAKTVPIDMTYDGDTGCIIHSRTAHFRIREHESARLDHVDRDSVAGGETQKRSHISRNFGLVTSQAHRPALAANAAFKIIYAQRGKQLDSQMTDTLIKVMGIFPPGSYVKLANGEIAVVAHHGPTPTAPIVYSFINPRGQAVNVYAKRECAHAEFAIKEVVIKSKVVVTLNQKSKIWGYKS